MYYIALLRRYHSIAAISIPLKAIDVVIPCCYYIIIYIYYYCDKEFLFQIFNFWNFIKI